MLFGITLTKDKPNPIGRESYEINQIDTASTLRQTALQPTSNYVAMKRQRTRIPSLTPASFSTNTQRIHAAVTSRATSIDSRDSISGECEIDELLKRAQTGDWKAESAVWFAYKRGSDDVAPDDSLYCQYDKAHGSKPVNIGDNPDRDVTLNVTGDAPRRVR